MRAVATELGVAFGEHEVADRHALIDTYRLRARWLASATVRRAGAGVGRAAITDLTAGSVTAGAAGGRFARALDVITALGFVAEEPAVGIGRGKTAE